MVKYQDSSIILQIEKLVKEIKSSKIYQDYLKERKKLLNNKKIMTKIALIKDLQKEYIKTGDQKLLDKVKENEESLEEIPLYIIYLQKERELNNILIPLMEELNTTFKELLQNDLF